MLPSPNCEPGPPGPTPLGGGVFFGQPLRNTATNRTQPNRQDHPLTHRIFLAFPSLLAPPYSRRDDHAGLVSSPPPPVNCLTLRPSLLVRYNRRLWLNTR